MSYSIQAIITKESDSKCCKKEGLTWVNLSQNIEMAPLVDVYCDLNSIPFLPLIDAGLKKVPDEISKICESLSAYGKVIYIEAEYFGGDGIQASAMWSKGAMIGEIVLAKNAINQALKFLGVKKIKDLDEFSSLGLEKHRSTEGWLKA